MTNSTAVPEWVYRAELRPPETDEEPWMPADPAAPRGLDLLDGATLLTAWWVYLTAAIAAALVAVLVVIGIRLAVSR